MRAIADSVSPPKTATLSSKDKDKADGPVQQVRRPRSHAFPAWDVLRMATIEGAQAVGLRDEVGSLGPGKQADLVRWRPKRRRRRLDLTELNLSPVLEALPNLVYAGSGHEVVTVMVAGNVLVRGGKVLIASADGIRAVAAGPVHREMALLEAMEKGHL
jgi:5-methylthioadenosine/S-adenosylhomocysteine deaminase